MISCYNLSLPHPRRDGALFDEASFEVEAGTWVDVTGESSSGKSVLFELLSLRARTSQGTFIVAGRTLARLSRRKLEALRRRIGACAQRPMLLDGRTVTENLLVPLVARGETRSAARKVDAMLEAFELEAVKSLPVHALTESERRVVAIARACVGEPELILIDGGLDGLDAAWRQRVKQALRRLHLDGATVVLFSREVVGPVSGRGAAFRLEQGRLETLERSVHAPMPEDGGLRR